MSRIQIQLHMLRFLRKNGTHELTFNGPVSFQIMVYIQGQAGQRTSMHAPEQAYTHAATSPQTMSFSRRPAVKCW